MYFYNDFETDCMILYNYLEPLNYYIGKDRRTGQFKKPIFEKGGGSVLYGLTFKGFLKYENGQKILRKRSDLNSTLFETKFRSEYPELLDIFKEFASLYFPNFDWVNVQINKDYICRPHFDSQNVGESIIIGLGDYEGGNLILDRGDHLEHVNIKNMIYKFDGSKVKHWTSQKKNKNTRISCVFFNNKWIKNKINKI